MATAAGYCRLSGGQSAGPRCRDEACGIREGAIGRKAAFNNGLSWW